ncbi:hypothetical protein EDC01DRAFT_644471 [Geopyxis carbonaria]|nr:hypothetical protein EDC01DRAFT_644471 [Geopyxis carbonaria]
MGARLTKPARSAAARKYPTHNRTVPSSPISPHNRTTPPSPTSTPSSQTTLGTPATPHASSISPHPGPTVHPAAYATSDPKDATILTDAADPDFDAMLRSVGTAHLGTPEARGGGADRMNPQLRTMAARARMEERGGVKVEVLREVLKRRDEGWTQEKVESTFALPRGTVGLLECVSNADEVRIGWGETEKWEKLEDQRRNV